MSAKDKRSMELVKNLSNKQKAVLYFSLICECNDTEIDQLESTLKWKEYRCRDLDFHQWRDSIFSAISVFGMMYWSEIARGLRRKAIREKATEEDVKDMQRFGAMATAMQEFCDQHGIQRGDVAKFIGVSFDWVDEMPEGIGIDLAYKDKMLQRLNAAMPIL